MPLTITISHPFLSIGAKTYFIAVGDSALIYVSSDGGVSWASTAKVQGNLEGVIRRHGYYALEYTTLKYCAPSNDVPPSLSFFLSFSLCYLSMLSFFLSFYVIFLTYFFAFFLFLFLFHFCIQFIHLLFHFFISIFSFCALTSVL
jgi:hypothetical protein